MCRSRDHLHGMPTAQRLLHDAAKQASLTERRVRGHRSTCSRWMSGAGRTYHAIWMNTVQKGITYGAPGLRGQARPATRARRAVCRRWSLCDRIYDWWCWKLHDCPATRAELAERIGVEVNQYGLLPLMVMHRQSPRARRVVAGPGVSPRMCRRLRRATPQRLSLALAAPAVDQWSMMGRGRNTFNLRAATHCIFVDTSDAILPLA